MSSKYPNNFKSYKSRKRAMRKRCKGIRYAMASASTRNHQRAAQAGVNVKQMVDALAGDSKQDKGSLLKTFGKLIGGKK